MVKDLFYSTRKTIFELFNEGKLTNSLDLEGLKKLVNAYASAKVNDSDIELVFSLVSRGKDAISYQEFEKAFKWDLPAGGEWETKAIRRIRDWMINNGYSSETAFELFCKSTGRIL